MDHLSYSPNLQHFLDLKRCADTNDTNAMLRLAKVYLNVNGENTNKKALCLLKQLANAAYTAAQTDAQYMLASCYENGKRITKNYKQAAKWYRQAYINANNDIYSAYEDKFSVLLSKPDEEIEPEVIDCVTESAENGDAEAQRYLMDLYQFGAKNVESNTEEYAYWAEKAAKNGDPYAMYEIGNAYYHGTGVNQDNEKAIYWLQKAENQGDPQAAFSLGWLYQTQKQYKIAANHYKNAARLNILRRNQLTTRNSSGEFIAKEH